MWRHVGGAAAALLLCAASAEASTLSATYYPYAGSCCESRADLSYVAAPGERNDFTLSHSALRWPVPRSVGFGDLGALITQVPLPIVEYGSGFGFVGVACAPLLVHVTCFTHAMNVGAHIDLGDGHDRATGAPVQVPPLDCRTPPCFGIVWDGGSGDDNITGTHVSDQMVGGDGKDVLNPVDGGDLVQAGNDDDLVRLSVDGVRDQVFCGAGIDTVLRTAVDPLDIVDADCEIVGP